MIETVTFAGRLAVGYEKREVKDDPEFLRLSEWVVYSTGFGNIWGSSWFGKGSRIEVRLGCVRTETPVRHSTSYSILMLDV